jgi:hypothetical protein
VSAATGYANTLIRMFRLPSAVQGYTQSLQLALIPSWNNVVVVLLAVAAMMRWQRLDTLMRDATLAILLTLAGRWLTGSIMGEGWGYRMFYVHLGSLALLAAVGADELRNAMGGRRSRMIIGVAAIIALLVQLPIRWIGVETTIAPYRDGYAWMSNLPYDVVVYPAEHVAWGRQLVRNDPFGENRPKILNHTQLTTAQLRALMSSGLRVKLISRPELYARGLPHALILFGGLIIAP